MAKTDTRPTRGGLAASPSHLMHRALQLALDIYTEEAGPDGLTQRQFAVLEAVSRKAGLTQTDLVRATGIDRSTLADLVARMTAKGLLERERSALDARAKAVRLSPAGEAALAAARPRVEAADKRIMGLLPKGKQDRLPRPAGYAGRRSRRRPAQGAGRGPGGEEGRTRGQEGDPDRKDVRQAEGGEGPGRRLTSTLSPSAAAPDRRSAAPSGGRWRSGRRRWSDRRPSPRNRGGRGPSRPAGPRTCGRGPDGRGRRGCWW